MSAIYRREMGTYLNSLTAYIFTAGLLLAGGAIFSSNNMLDGKTEFIPVLSAMMYAALLLTPLLTMHLMAAEREQRTDRLLLTAPISCRAVVLAKFLSAYTVYLSALVVSGLFTLVLALYGKPAWGEIMTGYLGLVLFGAALTAGGLLVSSLVRRTLAAALITLAAAFVALLLDRLIPYVASETAHLVIAQVSPLCNTAIFLSGFVSLSAVMYFLSLTGLFLLLTAAVLERQKWARGRCS